MRFALSSPRLWICCGGTAVLPLTFGVLLAGSLRSTLAAHAQSQLPEFIEAPGTWVPFSADLKITFPGQQDVVGRFFRASDGSRRMETGPSLTEVMAISITNFADLTLYQYYGTTGSWTSSPASPRGSEVQQWRKGLSNWSPYPRRLAVRAGESGSIDSETGFFAYRVTDDFGGFTLRVPELNFFNIVSATANARYEIYTNLHLDEPDPRLFRPPPPAVVTPNL